MFEPSRYAPLNMEAALDRVGGDEELLQEIAAIFLKECPVLLGEIRNALDARDAYTVERAAHTLKGSVSNFGAETVVAAALALENMGRAGDLSSAEPAWNRLNAELAAIRPALIALSE